MPYCTGPDVQPVQVRETMMMNVGGDGRQEGHGDPLRQCRHSQLCFFSANNIGGTSILDPVHRQEKFSRGHCWDFLESNPIP